MATVNDLIRNCDRLAEFEAYRLWENVRQLYDSLLVSAESDSKLEIVEVKQKYMRSYGTYVRGAALISDQLEHLRESVTNEKVQDLKTTSFAHLPPCEIDPFYGDYLKWPSFRETFKSMVANNQKIDPASKMYYLLQYTKGEPHKMIRTCPLTKEGFPIAWKNLMDRYENKRVLINAQLKILFNIKSVSYETGPNIKELQRTINDCITNLSLLDINTDSWDVIFVYIASTKLPDTTLSLWEQSEKRDPDMPMWNEMDKFLTLRYKTLESVSDIKGSHTYSPQRPVNNPNYINLKKSSQDSRKIKTFVSKTKQSQNLTQCVLCPENHPLRLCPIFLGQSIDDRLLTVEKMKFCTNCLASSHEYKACRSPHVCFICKHKHHSLLHKNSSRNPLRSSNSISTNSVTLNPSRLNPINTHTSNLGPSQYHKLEGHPNPSTSRDVQTYASQVDLNSQSTVLLGTTACEVLVGNVRYEARALIDPASQANFISQKLQRKLCLPTIKSTLTRITGLNDSLTATASKVCFITIGAKNNSHFSVQCEAYVVEKLTGLLPTYPTANLSSSNLPGIDQTEVTFTRVDLLLGGDVYPRIILPEIKKNPDGNLVAQNTIFGWIVIGKVISNNPLDSVKSYFNHMNLNKQITRFWELEEVPKATHFTEVETYCEQYYQSTTYRKPDGRYVVSLPFKKEYPKKLYLGTSRDIAMSQFKRNETRLLLKPDVKSNYDTVINEYFDLNHIQEVDPLIKGRTSYYLPHHAVFKPDSTTTKLRVVFNASNPSSNGVSLNDILYPGPVLQSDLMILILRWRFHRFVFNADIEKMYRQIQVNPSHTPFQRILYRENRNTEVKDFELTTVTFGINCAPYLAIRTLIQLANECEVQSPAVSEILRTQMYVDDVLAGSHELEEAIKRRNDLTNVLGSAGFVLRKWTANHKRLLEDLSSENLLTADFLKFSDTSTTKTLGLRWNASSDSFYFKLVTLPNRELATKRSVLSEIAKLFDPAGWLSPKIIVAKILMQQIWRDKTEWDECLTPLTLSKWQIFLEDYPNIEKINIPRWVNFHPDFDIEVHGFCDASEKAYAAALYIRAVTPSKHITTHLLTAKTKVAPVKFETLPRLELCGAILLANMVDSICVQMDLPKKSIHLWTDSTIVLSWLQKPPCHWPTFVANRVGLILKKVGNDNWLHVDSKNNPADMASRGILAQDLIDNTLWWHGPQWLRQPKEKWPKNQTVYHTNLETRVITTHLTSLAKSDDVLKRFSSLPRALRVIAYIFRFYTSLRKSDRIYESHELTRSEIVFVKTRLTLLSQQLYFDEYYFLLRGENLPRHSKLISLNPFLDSYGIMRVNGRLGQAVGLTYDERFPKLLPYCAPYTRLYLETVHKYSLHGGSSLLIRIVRIEFWVPKLRNLARTVVNNCKECVIHRKQTSHQMMAALPPERTYLGKPFEYTGVDFSGPFEIKSYSGRGCRISKSYVVVFVCFGTKAIHLEVTEDMSSEAFLAAFTRFISRRSLPRHIYSDNGTAFVGAAKLLSIDRKRFLQELRCKVLTLYTEDPLEWHFIPPGAPHMGGLWEAGVKSFKTHLKRITNSQKFTYAEFETMLIRIEACLNSRPLYPMSDDPKDLVPLTPGHFLVGRPLLARAEPDHSVLPTNLANRWQKLKILHHQFALRWKEEYLKELHKRTKWKFPQRNLMIGDLVVVRQDNMPPNLWRLGRIEKVYYGQDSKVRVADNSNMSKAVAKFKIHRSEDKADGDAAPVKIPQRDEGLRDCRICKSEHAIRVCPKFRKMSTGERWAAVTKHRYCFNCLAHSHMRNKCMSRERCRECLGDHHSLLHRFRYAKRKAHLKTRESIQSFHRASVDQRRKRRSNRKHKDLNAGEKTEQLQLQVQQLQQQIQTLQQPSRKHQPANQKHQSPQMHTPAYEMATIVINVQNGRVT